MITARGRPDHPAPEEGMMNHSIHVMRRPRGAWPTAARTAAVIIAAGSLALLATACSGSPSSTGSGGSSNAGEATSSQSTSAELLDFAQCMRSHDVPDFPDPSVNGKFPTAQQLSVTNSQYQSAMSACQSLLPPGTNDDVPSSQVQQILTGMLNYAECMRSHGVPNWPDPTNAPGGPVFVLLGIVGLDGNGVNSPRVEAAEQACLHLSPAAFGGRLPPIERN
jgi:hypothetical protein